MSMFQQYTGGIAPVQGISEAGANIGRFAQQGLQDFGKSLSEGIQEYNKNYALDQQATEEGHAVAQQLAFYHQMASMSPENAPLLPMLDEQVKTMQKLPSMSLTQKLGALNGAKATLSQFGANLQMNQLMQQQRAANDLLNFKPKADQVTQGITLDNTPFDPKFSPQENVDKFLRPALEQLKQNGVQVGTDDEVISQYLGGIKANLAKATDKSGKPIDPATQSVFSEQLDKYLGYQKNEMTDDSGVTDYAKEAALYDASSTATNDLVSNSLTVPAEVKKVQTQAEANATIDKAVAGGVSPEVINKMKTGLAEADVKGRQTPSHGVLVNKYEQARQTESLPLIKKIQQLDELITSAKTTTVGRGNRPYSPEDLAKRVASIPALEQEKADLQSKVQGIYDKYNPFIYGDKKTPEQLAADALKGTPSVNPNPSQIKPSDIPKAPEKPNVSISPVTADNIVAGRKDFEREASPEQQKAQAMQFFNKQYGYIPSSFNAIWEQQHPESKLQVIQKGGLTFYSDGKGEFKLVPQEKNAMSPEEAAKYGVRAYGGEEIAAGSGIHARGLILGEKPAEFKKELTAAGEAVRQIDALKNLMVNSNGRSLSPVARAEAQKYVAFLKSAIRPELFPSGRVAEWEQIILDQLVPNPTGIFTLDASTTKSLDVLREQVANNIRNTAANRGIEVSFNSANQVSSLAQDARIANRLAKQAPQPIRR